MNAATQNNMVAKLNSLYADCVEWQRGAIDLRSLKSRLGVILTADQVATVAGGIYRTMGRADVARLLASVIGL